MTAAPVSVIVVSRGRPSLLPRCLTGIGQLCYPAFEIVVVADTGGIEAVRAMGWQARVKLVAFDTANISQARNAGIAASTGEIIAFIDDDAVPEPTWLAHLAAPFADPDIAATGGFVIGRNGISFQWTARAVNARGEKIALDHSGDAPFEPSPPEGFVTKTEGTNCAFRRRALAEIGGFDPAFRFYMDETDVNLRLAQAGGRTVLVPLALTAVGGFGSLATAIPTHFHWLNGSKGGLWFLFVYYLIVLIKYNGNWAFVQRFYCMKDERAAWKMGVMSAVLFSLFPLIFMLPAFAATVLIPNLANPEEAYVSVCKMLLPPGAMGLMIAAMLSATMSTLSGEYNVTASVVTRDIYRRLLRPNAENREQMIVARLATVALGTVIVFGAMQVGRFGGAFEANKMLTGLIGVPLAAPLMFGMLWRRPRPWGVMASIIIGIASGLILNGIPGLSWQSATFGQILVCLGILIVSGLRESRCAEYRQRVTEFFNRLAIPVRESEETGDGASRGHRAIMILFAVSLGLSGLLFVGISLFSVALRSGQYALVAGLWCCSVAALLGWRLRKSRSSLRQVPQRGNEKC